MASHRSRIMTLARIAVLSVLGLLLRFQLLQVSILPAASFLKYDPADIPAILAGFAMGPLAGLAVEALKNLLALGAGMAPGGIIGETANIVAGGTFVLVSSIIYWRHKTRGMAVVGMAAGTVAAAVVMAVANYYIFLPIWGVPTDQLRMTTVRFILPFNLIKFTLSSGLTFLLYKRVRPFLG